MSNTNSTAGTRTINADEPIVTREQIKHLSDEGYLVRERLVQGELLIRLRDAVDELTEREKSKHSIEKFGIGGLFIRNLLDRHETFHELLNYAPTLSLAREILGYRLQVHALFLRVAYPDHKNQEVAWHFHQRLNREPNSKQRYQPIVLDNLIYLDDVTEENGPLCVLPKSHLLQEPPPNKDFSNKEGQRILTLPAGSCVSLQGSTLHRALPTLPGSSKRRLIMLAYSPTWMKQADIPVDGLSRKLRDSDSYEIRELAGKIPMR